MGKTFDLNDHREFAALWEQVAPFTLTSPERGFALFQGVNAVLDNDLPGSFVECGVWKGGSAMLIALTLKMRKANRPIYLFDTFEGMTAPNGNDVDFQGNSAEDLMAGSKGGRVAELVKAAAGLDEVRANLETTGYNINAIRFVKGDVKDTLPITHTGQIALLRLDTDFYDSTLAEMQQLWPRLSRGGSFIIDDYGHWQGAKKAFHAYFDDGDHGYKKPLLWRIDYTGFGGVKLEDRVEPGIRRYDRLPPGFETPDLARLFPHAAPQNPKPVKWPYLRKHVPHIWRTDSRDHKPWATGYASAEEAACLYTLAKQFAGQRMLEVGTHFGWTAAHLVAAGGQLDCIDPDLHLPARKVAVTHALDNVKRQVDGAGTYRLWGGFSPDVIEEVRASEEAPWSLAFIDGNHEDDGPRQDALAVLPHLADDALVVFHDLTSPFVERGLYVMRQAGFSTRLYNTMQILGLAWRGDVAVPDHERDPNVPMQLPWHLEKYQQTD
ncbi:MAG: TylF/MycF/NovP-related O-methyltransferase [Pseudomonadota bacterium]